MLLNYLKDNCRVYTVQVGQFIYSIRLETWVKLGIACLYIASLVIAVVTIWVEEGDNIEKLLQNFLRFVDGLSWYGILLYGVVYIGTVVILFPAVILTLGAGFVFGLWKGTLCVLVAGTVGATLAFLLGRTLLRSWIERKISQYPKFQAVDKAFREKGWLLVLLLRLTPVVPFVLVNYAFGLSDVRLWVYVVFTVIGMSPATVLYVYIGSAAENLSSISSGHERQGPVGQALFYCGLGVAVLLVIIITIIARNAIRKQLERTEVQEDKDSGGDTTHKFANPPKTLSV